MSPTVPPINPALRPSWVDVAPPLLEEAGLAVLGPELARQWGLVLSARRIPHRIRQGWPGLKLLVPPGREGEALGELRAYLKENPLEPVHLPDFRPGPGEGQPIWKELPGVLVSLGLATAFMTMTGAENTLGAFMLNWHGHGAGDTGLMARGEWWRAVTALTLHADVAHLMGNVCLGGTFLVLLSRQIGLGWAWLLSLAGGIWANLAKAPLQGSGYLFVGSSTAVFSALGVLAGVRLSRLPRDLRWKRALPFAAGVMILAFLGVGTEEEVRKIDLAGHFMGFGAGFAFGLGYAALERLFNKSGRALSPWMGAAAALVVITSWAFALLA
ncbi:MAG: rhomboid family intramembrane serine protease [Thermodesulfobacteriota bacterium]